MPDLCLIYAWFMPEFRSVDPWTGTLLIQGSVTPGLQVKSRHQGTNPIKVTLNAIHLGNGILVP